MVDFLVLNLIVLALPLADIIQGFQRFRNLLLVRRVSLRFSLSVVRLTCIGNFVNLLVFLVLGKLGKVTCLFRIVLVLEELDFDLLSVFYTARRDRGILGHRRPSFTRLG